ncbi:MAG: 2-hydroxyacyl-CoA dehydratase [Deltaproteobacteria bacterium]|nr:2-hydroxyacyl-CoA dehydratase [Deltaproteobacteria bacterium]
MRKAYIEEQKSRHGRKAVVVLPVHYPREILTAMNVLAVELWGPPGPPRGPEAGRLQTYVCAVVRNALAFIASGGADVADGALFPHTCDSVQGLATLAPDFGGWKKPAFRFIHPKGPLRASSRAFIRAEMVALAQSLATLGVAPPTDDALRDAIRLHREIDALKLRLADRRAYLPVNDADYYRVLRRGEFLWPTDHLNELRDIERKLLDTPAQKGIPIFITGYVPEPMSIFDVVAEAGAYVAGDDYAAVGRRVNSRTELDLSDPWAALVDLYDSASPCPTHSAEQAPRLAHLDAIMQRCGARGVIIHEQKFCEPQLFDVPALRRHFGAHGIPQLYLEGELESDFSGQARTRIEAFIETLSSPRSAA